MADHTPNHDSAGAALSRTQLEQRLLRYGPALFAFFRLNAGHLVLGREHCSDLVQSAFRDVIRSSPRLWLRDESEFKNLLFKTARNKLRDRYRHHARQLRSQEREIPLPPVGSTSHDEVLLHAYRTMYSPSHDAAAREELHRFERAFAALPEPWRELIALNRLGGLSYEQIAADQDKTPDAVRMQIQRGLARLAVLLEDSE